MPRAILLAVGGSGVTTSVPPGSGSCATGRTAPSVVDQPYTDLLRAVKFPEPERVQPLFVSFVVCCVAAAPFQALPPFFLCFSSGTSYCLARSAQGIGR